MKVYHQSSFDRWPFDNNSIQAIRGCKGRFIKGVRASQETEFKKGQHWRLPQKFRDKDWLVNEYLIKNRTAPDIANDFGVTPGAIIFWLRKHYIPRRDTSETRLIKKWGSPGARNPMYGKRGSLHPNWSGGVTPLRQKFYIKAEAKQWFKDIYSRDGKICRVCGSDKGLQVHHILPIRKYPLLIGDSSNGIVLCKSCHDKTKFKEHRYARKFLNLIGEQKSRGAK